MELDRRPLLRNDECDGRRPQCERRRRTSGTGTVLNSKLQPSCTVSSTSVMTYTAPLHPPAFLNDIQSQPPTLATPLQRERGP